MNRRNTLTTAAAIVAAAAMAGTSSTVEAFSPVVSMSKKPAATAAAGTLRMSADDEVAKLKAAAQKAREEAQALAKVSAMPACDTMPSLGFGAFIFMIVLWRIIHHKEAF